MYTNSNDFSVKKTIGSSWNVDEDDVVSTKSALKKTGDYKAPNWGVTGYPDQDMFDGLKSFQKREGLQVDGVMKPGGPTEKRLAQKTKPPSAAGPVARSMQPEAANRQRPDRRSSSNRTGGFAGPTDWSGIKMTSGPSLPPDATSEMGQELPGGRKRGPARKDKRPGEQEVAFAPLIPVIAAGGAALVRNGPQILRGLQGILRAAPPLVGAAEEARKQVERSERSRHDYPSPIPQLPKDEDRAKDQSNRIAIDPPPPTPGLEPPDEKLPGRTESPAKIEAGPTTEVFPNPGEREAVLETFPIDDSLGQWIILENNRGDDETQAKTDILIELYTDAYTRRGIKAKHMHGGRTAERKEKRKERYIKPTAGIGAARPDGSFQIGEPDDKAWDDFNTVDNLVDGRTPSARERRALEKIRRLYEAHSEKSSIADYPKLRGVSLEEFREIVRPLVEEFMDARHGKK